MSLFKLVVLALHASTFASAAVPKIQTVDHDLLQPIFAWPDQGSSGSSLSHTIYEKFKPVLRHTWGCYPYPAVDIEGHVSGGLAPTGPYSGDCTFHYGTTYLRFMPYKGKIALMYAWYFPKEMRRERFARQSKSSSNVLIDLLVGSALVDDGQRHFWTNIIVWLDHVDVRSPFKLSWIREDKYYNTPASTSWQVEGTRPVVYKIEGEVTVDWEHESDAIPEMPLVLYDELPEVVKSALDTYDWPSPMHVWPFGSQCPFNKANFATNVANAFAAEVRDPYSWDSADQ